MQKTASPFLITIITFLTALLLAGCVSIEEPLVATETRGAVSLEEPMMTITPTITTSLTPTPDFKTRRVLAKETKSAQETKTKIAHNLTATIIAQTPSATRKPTSTDIPITLTPEALYLPIKLAILSSTKQGEGLDIFYYETPASDWHRVTNIPEGNIYSFSWSPDGDTFVFSMSVVPGIRLYTINLYGDDYQQLDLPQPSRVRGSLVDPSWSPDGSTITFADEIGPTSYIYLVNPDGSNQRYLTEGSYPDWSPDGKKITYIIRPKNINTMFGDLYIINLENNQIQQMTENFNVTAPTWSPDGSYIIFRGFDEDEDGVYIYDVKDNSWSQIISGPSGSPFSWMNETEFLFYRQGNIYSYNLTTNKENLFFEADAFDRIFNFEVLPNP